ncbi:Deoxynucleotidyltransferase terminal-interacting protein 2 [Strongyloides ratti]|uniref:Deoxynucleotidyltransferase terminal-interacting protein 2 n=1 Tax=Strongyloides ratti TaxID=34506 RepID=A0A090L6Q8_STRRB|nr:Deoxynucleotidyltransferase terminal-interacting protein 2 [Strongyloides ratti]CEF65481.1 Deoxynucleotidyltransferase terminal-interacting protein 2 [Strongyloides ratti]
MPLIKKKRGILDDVNIKISPDINKIMKNSVVGPAIEKNIGQCMRDKKIGEKKKERKLNREETAGKGWFDMKSPEMTDEIRRDLEVIQMRGAIDPKAHYKKNASKELPKHFQIGTVIETKADFYSSRLTNKERKRTIVDELLAEYDKKKKS